MIKRINKNVVPLFFSTKIHSNIQVFLLYLSKGVANNISELANAIEQLIVSNLNQIYIGDFNYDCREKVISLC